MTSSNHNGMKLEINNRRKIRKFKNMWKLNTLLNTNGSKKKSREKKYPEINRNGNTAYPNIWDTANTVLRGKFILNAYIKK